jgi:hypothetical protein
MKKVVDVLYALKNEMDGNTASSGFVYTHGQLTTNPLQGFNIGQILNSAPQCIKLLHHKSTDLKDVRTNHLKNTDRFVFGKYLMMCGWTSNQVAMYWKPKIDVIYEQDSERRTAMRGIHQTLQWSSRGSNETGISCMYLMTKHMCPHSNAVAGSNALARCIQHMNEKIKSSSSIAKPVFTTLRSPFHFTRQVVEAKK